MAPLQPNSTSPLNAPAHALAHPRTISLASGHYIAPEPRHLDVAVRPPGRCMLLACPPEIVLMVVSLCDERSVAKLGMTSMRLRGIDSRRFEQASKNIGEANQWFVQLVTSMEAGLDDHLDEHDVEKVGVHSSRWTPEQVDRLVRLTQDPIFGTLIQERAQFVGAAISGQHPAVAQAIALSMDQIGLLETEHGISQEAADRELRSEYLAWVLASIGPHAEPGVYQPFIERMQSDRYGITHDDTAWLLVEAIPRLPAHVGDHVVDFILTHEGTIDVEADRDVQFRYVGTRRLFRGSQWLSQPKRDDVFGSAKAICARLSDEDDIACMEADFLQRHTFVSEAEEKRWSALFAR